MYAEKSKQPDRLITVQNLEHPRSVTRRIRACLTLAGAAAAGVLALTATSPAANADTVDLPDLPSLTGEPINPESLGVAPLFTALAEQYNGSYTDSLGVSVNTTAPFTPEPLQVDAYGFNGINPTFIAETITDPNGGVAGIEGGSVDGTAEGSTFSQIFTTSGLVNFYEDTPFYATGASDATQNINDAFVFDPTGSPLTDLSGIEFGIQYLDLPDATSGPIDAINFLGSGGEILFSIPVTGDLLAGL
jgi:hypothetical protein